VQDTLGKGGMGVVYLAHDDQLDRQVALKVPHVPSVQFPKARMRFLREARAAAALSHPNICPVYDIGEQDGFLYLAMAYIEGDSLAKRLREKGPFAPEEAAQLVLKMALALQEAHGRGIIHRDLKPANVLLNTRDEPVIMDFGLARLLADDEERMTQNGQVMGTPAYMAPEQIRGDVDNLGPSCDIYSLGVVLYEMLTGRPPFRGSLNSVLAQALTQEAPAPSEFRPDLDERLGKICVKAVARDIEHRYATMADFARALTDYLEASTTAMTLPRPGTAPPSKPVPPPDRRAVGPWLAAGIACAVLLVGGVVFGPGFFQRKPAEIAAGPPPTTEATEPAKPPKPAPTTPETPPPPPKPGPEANALAAQVKEVFRARCSECHGAGKARGGVRILDRDLLVKKEMVLPGKPTDSVLIQRLTATDDSVMPPVGQPALAAGDIDAVRKWIAADAPAFPADAPPVAEKEKDPALKNVAGVDHVLKKILEHVRSLPVEDRSYVRYFSINHLLTAGATPEELDLQRDALAKAVNSLSWEPTIVRPKSIDAPHDTVYCVDIRSLGWQKPAFTRARDGKWVPLRFNLFDLALLEYPYGVLYEDAEVFDHVAEEFLLPSGMVRPIPYVRADWFVSVATLPPLYDDFLQLPLEIGPLEERLGVDSARNLKEVVARRAGLTVSGVSRNNRAVERHPSRYGAYWKSFDFRTSKGQENLCQDPVNLKPSGGEMVFHLPNGLQGYYVCDSTGRRIEAAPTEIVTDKFAEDKTVRNGLSCMRCHDAGMKGFKDDVRAATERLPGTPGFDRRLVMRLYPPQEEMDRLVEEDTRRFQKALEQALGKPQVREPLVPVTHRFLDAPLQLVQAGGELGLVDSKELPVIFKLPQLSSLGLAPLAADGSIRRDTWESYYDVVVRNLGIGVPVVPLDSITRLEVTTSPLAAGTELRTNKKNNQFEPGDGMLVYVTNRSVGDLYIELIGTSARGEKTILTAPGLVVRAGQSYTFPPDGKPVKIRGGLGKEQITLFASDQAFPAGVVVRAENIGDRVVHLFYEMSRRDQRLRLRTDPARIVKKTIEIETR
jgi:serine/threonine-protein kinase